MKNDLSTHVTLLSGKTLRDVRHIVARLATEALASCYRLQAVLPPTCPAMALIRNVRAYLVTIRIEDIHTEEEAHRVLDAIGKKLLPLVDHASACPPTRRTSA